MPLPIDFSKLAPQDILDMAAHIEREAEQRYEVFAQHLEQHGDREGAEFFATMARIEGAHGEVVAGRREREFVGLPAHLRDVVEWDVEGPPLDRRVRVLSMDEALAMALAAEIRARDFFAGAMEQSADDEVTRVLSELHRDELEHIRMLEVRGARLAGR
jgi:rubrerythrin